MPPIFKFNPYLSPNVSPTEESLVISFVHYDGFQAGATQEIYEQGGIFTRLRIPIKGSIVRTLIQSSPGRNSGEIIAKPTIAGIPASSTTWAKLDSINPDFAFVSIPSQSIQVAQGQEIGMILDSSQDWSPINNNIQVFLYLVLNS